MDSAPALAQPEDQTWIAAPDAPSRLNAATAILCDALTALERLAGEWTALAAEASEPNAFAEFWFAAAGVRHFARNADVRVVEVRRSGRLIGVMPLHIVPRYGRIPLRHVENWLHYHCFLATPLVRKGEEQSFWSALLDRLDREAWAKGFLHINGLVEGGPLHKGLAAAAQDAGRSCDTVLRIERALLGHGLGAAAYCEHHVRKKKRKELKRLRSRLDELGTVAVRTLSDRADLSSWCDDFLALEKSGWKGREGSALGCAAHTEAFFREVVTGAFDAGRLDLIRLDLDGRPLAMLVNFITLPGSFSFKIAFDEGHARFSPGVLLLIENLAVLERPGFEWMDSCAVENHSMINSLWAERRSVIRVSVPFGTVRGRIAFRLCRTIESLSAALRRRFPPPQIAPIVAEQESND
jgi:CelD/BcsL family acetyltransferase involved in cellulose biosynthesis